MNAFSLRAYGRVLWHEAAERYTFCIGIFALLITMQASMATMDSFNIIRPPEIAFGFGMALFMTAIYAAASCALLLTADVDAGTFVFHRTKPVGWFSYLGGKLSWVVLSSLLLGLLGWIETGVWLGSFPNAREASFAFGVTGVGILEGLAWGLIASMLFREPLRAVIAGIAMASAAAYVTVVFHHLATGGGTAAVTAAYSRAAWPRLAVAAAVLATGLPLARVWYRTGQPLRPWALPRFLRGEARPAAVAGGWDSLPRPRRGRAIRLVWHAWRQIRTPVLVYWGVNLATWAVAGLYHLFHEGDSRVSGGDLLNIAIDVIVVFSPLLAGYTFGADQKTRFLQLARDGVSPWEIWLSRLAVMAAALLPAAVVVFASVWFVIPPDDRQTLKSLAVLLVVLGYVSVLVIGQACSMFVRSRIVALLAAPVMTACFAFWIAVGVFLLGLGWKLGAAPMLLALLIGSRLLAGSRLRQDTSWRAMRVPALLIVTAFAFTFLAFAHHRTSEIRPYDSVTKVDLRLMNLPPKTVVKNSSRRPADWTKGLAPGQWTEWMEHALQTRGDMASRTSADVIRIPWRGNSSAVFEKTYAEMLMADAQLYRALRKATSRPRIGNEQLRVCLEFLEDWAAERSGHAQWLATYCQRDIFWLRYGPTEGYAAYGFHDEPLPWSYRWLPFERTRALQLLDRAYRIAADRAEEYETAVLNDQIGIRPYGGYGRGLITSEDILPYDPSRPFWYQMSHEIVLETGTHFRLLRSLRAMPWSQADPLYTAESQRRATILYLALRMYANDHGELPDSLDALTEGKYLNRLPVVPIACQRFYYEPRGASEELNAILAKRNPDQADMPAPVPFLDEHDPALPFLWYPLLPNHTMDPAAGAGLFIDLDFVK